MRANIGRGESWLRMCSGLLCMVCGLLFLKGSLLGYLIAISGCITFLTSAVRWSPLWATKGRELQG